MAPEIDQLERRIMEALNSRVPVAALAESLGVTDARVLWHLERLAAGGYVHGDGADGDWRRTSAGDEALGEPVAGPKTDSYPARLVYDYGQALVEAEAGMYGAEYVQRSGEHASRMSHAQAAEFTDRLLALVDEYFAPGRGDRAGLKYGFHWILTPVDLRPLDD
ncbi:MAG: winged helix-turn-helix transcriptional regulator [Actinopolymorphaceae bacterium]